MPRTSRARGFQLLVALLGMALLGALSGLRSPAAASTTSASTASGTAEVVPPFTATD